MSKRTTFDLSVNTRTVSEHAQKTLIYSTEENEQIDLTKRIQLIHQFGDDGTIVWLNKHGELLSLSQSLQDESGEAKFISAERREIVAFDAKFPKRIQSSTSDSAENEAQEGKSLSNENEPDIETERNDEFRPVFADWEAPYWKSRIQSFGRLYEKPNSGFGLRLSPDSGKLELCSIRYRDDRWPLYQLNIKDASIGIKVQYFISRNQILQRYTITSTAATSAELSMDFDLTAALRQTLLGKVQVGPGFSHESHHSIRKQSSGQVSLQGPSQKLTVALFKGKDNASVPLSDIEEKDTISIQSTAAIYHHEVFQIQPQETITFTAIYMVTNNKENMTNLTLDKDTDSELNGIKEMRRWWRFKRDSQTTSFIYRRTLEHIVSVAAIPLPVSAESHSSIEGFRPYILTDASVELAHVPLESRWQMKFLFGMYRLLSTGDFADPQTTKHYMQKIQLITKGYLWWRFEMKKTPQDEQDYMQVEEWDEKGPKTNEPTDWIAMSYQFPSDPQMFCDSLVLLHQFQTLFPGETPFVQRIFRKHSPEYWKLINAHKDKFSTSDLWVSISIEYYQDIPVGVKYFGIDYQIQVWMAMDATKKLAELLQISEEDNTFNFLKDINPQNFRINVIERFKIERSIEVDLPNTLTQDRKQMLCAVSRSSYQESNIEISSWQVDLLVPALNRNFFFLDDLVFVPWIDTLRSQDWSRWEDAAAQDFESKMTSALMNYLSRYMKCNDEGSATNLHTARRDLESLSSAGGLFHNAAPIYNCLEYISSETPVLLLYTDYAAEFDAVQPESAAMSAQRERSRSAITPAEGIARMAQKQQHEPRSPQQSEPANLRIATQKGDKLDKKQRLAPEQRRYLNENPAYGPPWLFLGPLFVVDYEYAKPQSMGSFDDIKKRLLDNLDADWITGLWGSSSDCEGFFKRMTIDEAAPNPNPNPNPKTMTDLNALVDFGDKSKHSSFGNGSQLFSGSSVVNQLVKVRDKKSSKKRIVRVEDCTRGFIFTLLATHNEGEAKQLANFIYKAVADCQTTHYFRPVPQQGLWISEFCLGFIEISAHRDKDQRQRDQQRYFPARRSPFITTGLSSRGPPEYDLREASCGFCCLGDIHDRYWTLYFFVNADTSESYKLCDLICPSQRKVLEVQIVLIALKMLLEYTHKILKRVDAISSPEKNSLFDRYSSEGGSGDQTFKNRYKHSVLYPWLIELLKRLFKKCDTAQNAVKDFLDIEKNFGKNKPRWSAGDQKSYGEKIGKLHKEVDQQLSKLRDITKDINERIEWFKNLKEWASSELSLQDARRSVILSESARIFTVVTLIYLPLSFATSVVAVNGLTWGSPVKDLFKIIGIVSIGTIVILVNLNFLDRQFWYLVSRAHKLLQGKMEHKPPVGVTPPNDPEAGNKPDAYLYTKKKGFWSQKAKKLRVMDSRKELLGDSQSQFPETSSWWYWGFIVFYAVVKLPVTEITFAVRTTGVNVERVGPLQRLVRLPWFGLWLVLLILVYVVLVLCGCLMKGLGLIRDGFKRGWYGKAVKEEKKVTNEAGDVNAEEEEEEEEEDEVKATSWWKKPYFAMELELVTEAYRARKTTTVPAVAAADLREGVNDANSAEAPAVPQQTVEADAEGKK